MKPWSNWQRPLAYVAVITIISLAYYLGRGGRSSNEADDANALPPDPGYAARDAEVIETGYDGRERYRLTAKVIRQQSETAAIELESLAMAYHPDAQARAPGDTAPGPRTAEGKTSDETWHLTSDHGQVRADGDDVQLSGNVRVTGPAPGSGEPLQMTTSQLRINTPTEFFETRAPVQLSWAGHEITAVGMQADLKAGKLRLESAVHGTFAKSSSPTPGPKQ
jgi:LPS export ABC transporter protein LptC